MAASFFTIVAPSGSGNGASVDISTLSSKKQAVIQSDGMSGEAFLEFSEEGTRWFTVGKIDESPPLKIFNIAARFARIRRQKTLTGDTLPSIVIGGEAVSGNVFSAIASPASPNAAGMALDVSAYPPTKTIEVTGNFRGKIHIQGSMNGVNYENILSFNALQGQTIATTLETALTRIRLQGEGNVTGDTVSASIGASVESEGEALDPSFSVTPTQIKWNVGGADPIFFDMQFQRNVNGPTALGVYNPNAGAGASAAVVASADVAYLQMNAVSAVQAEPKLTLNAVDGDLTVSVPSVGKKLRMGVEGINGLRIEKSGATVILQAIARFELTETQAAAADVLTLANGPAGAAGPADIYFVIRQGAVKYATPGWIVP